MLVRFCAIETPVLQVRQLVPEDDGLHPARASEPQGRCSGAAVPSRHRDVPPLRGALLCLKAASGAGRPWAIQQGPRLAAVSSRHFRAVYGLQRS